MTNLQNNTASLQAILETVNNLPEAGSGSGGGNTNVETCTVLVSTNNGFPIIYSTINENNEESIKWTDGSLTSQMSHSLIVTCGSYIFIPIVSTIPESNITGGAQFVDTLVGYSTYRTMVFKIVANANETVTINCYDDD